MVGSGILHPVGELRQNRRKDVLNGLIKEEFPLESLAVGKVWVSPLVPAFRGIKVLGEENTLDSSFFPEGFAGNDRLLCHGVAGWVAESYPVVEVISTILPQSSLGDVVSVQFV